jgi:hypothetical protein
MTRRRLGIGAASRGLHSREDGTRRIVAYDKSVRPFKLYGKNHSTSDCIDLRSVDILTTSKRKKRTASLAHSGAVIDNLGMDCGGWLADDWIEPDDVPRLQLHLPLLVISGGQRMGDDL